MTDQQLERALRAMAEALEAGISVQAWLDNPAAQAFWSSRHRDALSEGLASGGTLTGVFARLGVLTEAELALLGAGEKRGHAEEAMVAIAEGMKQRRTDRNRLLMGLAYPALLVAAASCLIPLPRVVTAGVISYLVVAVWGPLGVTLAALWALVVVPRLGPRSVWRRGPRRLGLSLPLLGSSLRRGAHGVFLKTLGQGLGAGLPVVEALQSATLAADEPQLTRALEGVLAQMRDGATLTEGLSSAKVLHPQALALVGQGELTGKLEEALPRAAAAEQAVARWATVIVLGLLTGVAMLGVVLIIAVNIIQGFAGYFEVLDANLQF